MAVKAKYGPPLQVVETDEMRARILAIAERENISQAQVVREMNRYAIDWREELSERLVEPD